MFVTGDITDNAQRNELQLGDDAARRRRASTPDSGAPGYRGVQAGGNPDPFYYRPDVDPPRHPGLLAQAQRPVTSPGLDAPWYGPARQPRRPAAGRAAARRPRRTRSRRATGSSPRSTRARGCRDAATTEEAVDALLGAAEGGRAITVPADPDRRHLDPTGLVTELAHGRPTRTPDRADHVVDFGEDVRFVLLDLTNRAGGQAPVTDAGAARLAATTQLDDARATGGPRHPPARRRTRCSPSSTATRTSSPRSTATGTATASTPRGGYWIVGTSSLADHPMQSRMVRAARARDRDVDGRPGRPRASPAPPASSRSSTPRAAAPRATRAAPADRNARLYLP